MFVFSKVDEMFGFLPEEKTPAIVSAPTAFKVRLVITQCICYTVTLCLEPCFALLSGFPF